MRKFSIRPTLTLKGRKFNGLRGWAGKPLHPPLTDPHHGVLPGRGLRRHLGHRRHRPRLGRGVLARRYVLFRRGRRRIGVRRADRSVGRLEVVGSRYAGTAHDQQPRDDHGHRDRVRHWRLDTYHTELVTPGGLVVLSVVVALLVSLGATFGGTLVYDYGFNVETAGDSPVWHKSETDVLPGRHDA